MSGTSRTRTALLLAAVFIALCATLSAPAAEEKDKDELLARVDNNDLSFYQRPASTEPYPQIEGTDVRNVIFMIGDGMGLSQVALARIKAVGVPGKLNLERLPLCGLVRTHSADNLVTDSAAAGTALACGVKTRNKMLGMTRDGTHYETLLEAAKAKGMATGLVVTSTISHATPASFAAHVRSRTSEDLIAEQLIAAKVNVLLGGGRKFFLPSSEPNSARKDSRNLIDEARQAGYAYVETADELQNAQASYVLGLFEMSHMTTVSPEPPLAAMAKKAIGLLRDRHPDASADPNGFFLMVEGSQIDFACHNNDAPACIRQTLLFDQAVEVVMDFAVTDKHTLVLVTADHETGGLTIPSGSIRSRNAKAAWSTKGHSATPVPVYAFGPGANAFVGVFDNTELSAKVAHLMGIETWPQPLK
jgi:alkaline phosphatase